MHGLQGIIKCFWEMQAVQGGCSYGSTIMVGNIPIIWTPGDNMDVRDGKHVAIMICTGQYQGGFMCMSVIDYSILQGLTKQDTLQMEAINSFNTPKQ